MMSHCLHAFKDAVKRLGLRLWLGRTEFEREGQTAPSPRPYDTHLASTSMILFGAANVLSWILFIIFSGKFGFGFIGVLAMLIGLHLATGSRSAARWGVGCMGCIALWSLLLTIGIATSPAQLLRFDPRWWVPGVMVAMAWALFNLVLCARMLRHYKRAERALCGRCGYPIGVSPVCTECGAVVTMN